MHASFEPPARARAVVAIVFSEDRALQLDAALGSFARHCVDPHLVQRTVLYRATTPESAAEYRRLAADHPEVEFLRERHLKHDVERLMAMHPFTLFVLDETLFCRAFSVADGLAVLEGIPSALGFSYRLGANTTRSTMLGRPQRAPAFEGVGEGDAGAPLLAFRWTDGDGDYGYPLEIASSMYRSAELIPVLRPAALPAPLAVEAALAAASASFAASHPELACAATSAAFSVLGGAPAGPTAAGPRFSAGDRVDVEAADGFVPEACHHAVALPWRRTAPPVAADAARDGDARTARASGAAAPAPRVSVVVPCYNYGRYLRHAIDSVLLQTFTDWEMIVVDDGSTDDSREVAARAIAEHPGRRIRLVTQPNSGQPAYPRNRGIRESAGEYLLCLDPDDLLAPTMIEECVRVLDAEPGVSVAYADTVVFGGRQPSYLWSADYDVTRFPHENLHAYCALVRREAWEAVGGYATNVPGHEDWNFWISCAERRHYGRRIPLGLFFYRHHGGGLIARAASRDLALRARMVLDHPAFYAPATRAIAAAVAEERPVPFPFAWEDVDRGLADGILARALAELAAPVAAAHAHRASGTLPAAVAAAARAVADAPGNDAALATLGALLLVAGRTAEGMTCCLRAGVPFRAAAERLASGV